LLVVLDSEVRKREYYDANFGIGPLAISATAFRGTF
jgi:hypothetical protein